MNTVYVLGFMFSPNNDMVVLIRKEKPDWQKGLLNGVGGKMEPDESPARAMAREFEEETGCRTRETKWRKYARLQGDFGSCYVFAYTGSPEEFASLRTTTIEQVCIINPIEVHAYKTISNLPWLVAMGMDKDNFYSSVSYNSFQNAV